MRRLVDPGVAPPVVIGENGTGGTISRDTAYLDAVGRFLAGSVPATSTR
jgi:hypothetical protein